LRDVLVRSSLRLTEQSHMGCVLACLRSFRNTQRSEQTATP
jgi:hypothetical protein